MAKGLFKIDGIAYDVFVPVGGIQRSAKILDGPNAGRLMTGDMTRDVIGTYYNYKISIKRDGSNHADYDRLYEIVTSPVDHHTVTVPYGQDTLTFQAYVTSADDKLTRVSGDVNYWDGFTMEFVAMGPERRK